MKIAQIAQINQLFQLLHSVYIYGHCFYELSRLLMRKNVNNDVNKDSPITVLQSRSQRPRSFCTATGITYVWKNPKKDHLRLAEKNRVYHMQISLLIKKP